VLLARLTVGFLPPRGVGAIGFLLVGSFVTCAEAHHAQTALLAEFTDLTRPRPIDTLGVSMIRQRSQNQLSRAVTGVSRSRPHKSPEAFSGASAEIHFDGKRPNRRPDSLRFRLCRIAASFKRACDSDSRHMDVSSALVKSARIPAQNNIVDEKPAYRRLASNGALPRGPPVNSPSRLRAPITPKSQKYRREFRQFWQTVQ
jgi:hypothetical protein